MRNIAGRLHESVAIVLLSLHFRSNLMRTFLGTMDLLVRFGFGGSVGVPFQAEKALFLDWINGRLDC